MSLPEVLLWRLLRKASPPIRRQHPIGSYVLDFYCPAAKLVIEVYGFAHETGDRPARDEARDAWLRAQGLRVEHIAASDVLRDPGGCADAVLRLCQAGSQPI
jgi:very-short-patch-repair endonuclease